jgi:hypothetical protein
MMGAGFGGVWMSWLLWGGLVVLMAAGWVLLVNWAMQGNGGTVASRPAAASNRAVENHPRRRDAAGEVAPPADDQAAETASVPAGPSAETGTHGEESQRGATR